jgi:hypothetical protein
MFRAAKEGISLSLSLSLSLFQSPDACSRSHDDDVTRLLLRSALTKLGHDVSKAANGCAALDERTASASSKSGAPA